MVVCARHGSAGRQKSINSKVVSRRFIEFASRPCFRFKSGMLSLVVSGLYPTIVRSRLCKHGCAHTSFGGSFPPVLAGKSHPCFEHKDDEAAVSGRATIKQQR
jgi:hypothetical protein